MSSLQESEPSSSLFQKISKIFCFLGVFALLMSPVAVSQAYASGETGASRIFGFARKKANNVYGHTRQAIYTIAALAAIVLAIAAFFGRFKWSTLFYWALGLFLLGGVQALIDLLYYGNFTGDGS